MNYPLPTIESEPYAWPFNGDWSPENTVLLSIDYQRDLFENNGILSQSDLKPHRAPKTLESAAKTLSWAREIGIPVVHTRQVYNAHGYNLHHQREAWSKRVGLTIGEAGQLGKFLISGEPGSNLLPELQAVDHEAIVDRPAVNPFLNSDLHNLLSKMGVCNLIIQGGIIEGSVHAAVCAANDRGYEVLLLTDCCATGKPAYAETVERTTILGGGLFGTISTSDQLITSVTSLR